MKKYVVVYIVNGIHYRYRCYAKNKRDAENACIEMMGVAKKNIRETYEE